MTRCFGLHFTRSFSSPSANLSLTRTPLSPLESSQTQRSSPFLQATASPSAALGSTKINGALACAIVQCIEVDTLQMQARLPQDTLEAAITLVRAFSRRRKVALRELQSLIGILNFACKVVVPGRPFLRRLTDLTMGIAKPHFHIRLGQEASLDLVTWLMFLENNNRSSLLIIDLSHSSETLHLFTDASGFGFAGVLKGQWFQGQ